MLFHFSFYSDKQPAIPACRDAHSVAAGEYHFSKIKSPGTVADQFKLSISELVLRSLRLGLNAAHANFVPAVLVQILMGGLVLSYFYLPIARPVFGILTDWNVHGGLLFSFFAMGITVGGLTETFSVYLHKNGRWTSEQFSFRETVAKMRKFRQFYVLTVLPVLVSNWLFWIPMVILIYCFPTSLQLPLGILACAIWSMLVAALVEPADARVGLTEELPGKLSVSDSAGP